ncbi:MAG: hypothetical protein ACF787_11790 [Rhodopirellula sp. JB053]
MADIDAFLPLDGVNPLAYLENGEPGLPHDVLFWRRGCGSRGTLEPGSRGGQPGCAV